MIILIKSEISYAIIYEDFHLSLSIFLHFPHFSFIVVCNSLCMPWWAKNTFRFQKIIPFLIWEIVSRESSSSRRRRRRIILANVIVFYTFFCSSSSLSLFIMIYFAITQMLSTFAAEIAVVICYTHTVSIMSHSNCAPRCKNRDWARKWM